MKPEAVQALVRLMEDPDERIYAHVRDELKSYGPTAIPYLESSWEQSDLGLLFQHRVEELIHEIHFEGIINDLTLWSKCQHKDLLEGALLVARYQYPGMDVQKVKQEIENIRRDIWLEINPTMTSFEKIKVFNKVFFELHRFRGNSKNFHSPLNSFINTVIEQRKGNPLSLSIIYSVVAQSLGIPVYGVNLPNHFILAYMDEHKVVTQAGHENPYGVLFYINPFSKGSLLYHRDIVDFLANLNIPEQRAFFEPCSNTQILHRMLSNLIAAFQQVGNARKVDELLQLRNLVQPKEVQE